MSKPKKTLTNDSRKLVSTTGNYWLVKSEPMVFSIDDLIKVPRQVTCWDGVRNYQARNILRDEMQVGDLALFHHSNAKPPAVVGVVQIARAGYPDHTAFDPENEHYDAKSHRAKPTWYMVDVKFVLKFAKPLSIQDLKQLPELNKMMLLQRGSRLSVQPVRPAEFAVIVQAGCPIQHSK
ncbi:MAG TPA: EVE domain-containing protein [Planctomycetaceae bacterium]|nr:EVE domain-containing protein [Planctomycetaceae bacterium]